MFKCLPIFAAEVLTSSNRVESLINGEADHESCAPLPPGIPVEIYLMDRPYTAPLDGNQLFIKKKYKIK